MAVIIDNRNNNKIDQKSNKRRNLKMAYPIRLFDFYSPEGRKSAEQFLLDLDKTLTSSFGRVGPQDKLKKYHIFTSETFPTYLKELAEKTVKEIIKELPEGKLNWNGSVGLYGRKDASTIKAKQGLAYRMIINIGDTEVYYLSQNNNSTPVGLPNGYALLLSPVMTDKADIKVWSDPVRKTLSKELSEIVPKIRGRQYMRCTIVLDLPLEGLEFPTLSETPCENKE